MVDLVALDLVAGAEGPELGLVGDDPEGAGLGACAVEGALRTDQGLDPGDVVDMDVEGAADGGDRLLVQIDADAGQGAGVVAIVAADDAAHVDVADPRRAARGARDAGAREGHARQELLIVVEVRDVQLLQLRAVEQLDAHRHPLNVLLTLLRGDHQLVVGRRALAIRRRRRCCASDHHRCSQ